MGAGASTGSVVYHCHQCNASFKPPPVTEDFPEIPVTTCVECGSEFLERGIERVVPEDAVTLLRACAGAGEALTPEELFMNLAILRPDPNEVTMTSGSRVDYDEEETIEERMVAQAATASMEEAEAAQNPTPPSILNALPKTKVDRSFRWSRVPGGSKECSICFSDMAVGAIVRTLPCKHVFHSKCIMPWLKAQDFCPICRHCLLEELS